MERASDNRGVLPVPVPGEAQSRATVRVHHLPVQQGLVSGKGQALGVSAESAKVQGCVCGTPEVSCVSGGGVGH
jgi:hypothetical protein